MNRRRLIAAATITLLLGVCTREASPKTWMLNSQHGGSYYTCNGCNPSLNTFYITVAGGINGYLQFNTTDIHEPISEALLALTSATLSQDAEQINVYGRLAYSPPPPPGTFVGTWNVLDRRDGTAFVYDVTSLLQTTPVGELDFNLLRLSGGSNTFNPSGYLIVTTIPEPTSCTLVGAALIAWLSIPRRRRP